MTRILVIEHDASDPALRLGDWLTEAGAELTICRPHAGDAVPSDLTGFDALISMGGDMGARDDDRAPWLPATRSLLAARGRHRRPRPWASAWAVNCWPPPPAAPCARVRTARRSAPT